MHNHRILGLKAANTVNYLSPRSSPMASLFVCLFIFSGLKGFLALKAESKPYTVSAGCFEVLAI